MNPHIDNRSAARFENLRERTIRLLSAPEKVRPKQAHLSLEKFAIDDSIRTPKSSIKELLDFLTNCLPTGDVYLYGGVLRDIAFFGKRGFNSDLDLVVEGDWDTCSTYLIALGARRNKFGGFRLTVAGWPVDIWSAPKTWAFEQGLVRYHGISSLTLTTILNWDAILMNWRTRQFICSDRYLDDIHERRLDVVFEENPNPIGMAVRVFRHLCAKDAREITARAAGYLASCVRKFSLTEMRAAEIVSYQKCIIDEGFFRLFEETRVSELPEMYSKFRASRHSLNHEMPINS